MLDDDCIFCKIIAGKISSKIIYENDYVIAFEDANPQMPVHTLIVPKNHYSSIIDDIPKSELGEIFDAVKTVTKIKNVAQNGFRLTVNTGDDAQQTVHHLHIHILGGGPMKIGSPALD